MRANWHHPRRYTTKLRRRGLTSYVCCHHRLGYLIGTIFRAAFELLTQANDGCSFGQSPSHTVRSILYSMLDGKVMFSFSMRPLVGNRSSPRSCGIPDLSKSQIEAINMVQSVAERHALSMKLKPGDLLFWNNMALLHSRAGFTDSSDRKRHLLRLWLRNDATEKHWPVPEVLQASWNDAFVHAERPQLWPIEPIRDRDYIINQQRSSGHD